MAQTMKVPSSLRAIYEERKEFYDDMRAYVDERIKPILSPRWHYESRVKGQESFALKIESGRFAEPRTLEDFLGVTIVVENLANVNRVLKELDKVTEEVWRRPPNPGISLQAADTFSFDYLRLYVKTRPRPSVPISVYDGTVFELQIRTFLQHAWTIATHDFLYKANEVNWPKERLGYQVKAMLDHADVSLLEADAYAASTYLKKEDKQTKRLRSVITLLKRTWSESDLPTDIRRLAANIVQLLIEMRLDVRDLKTILDDESNQGRGAKLVNLSPYGVVVESIMRKHPDKVREFLSKKTRFRLVVPEEVTVPSELDLNESENVLSIAQ